jgi:hypothetical protein
MPNRNNPFGFLPVGRSIAGGCLQYHERNVVVGYATAIRTGDVFNRVADGSIERSITPGTTLISGVAMTPNPASTAGTVLTLEDPFTIFQAQADGLLALTDMGLNANVKLTNTALARRSEDQIDSTTEAVTGTLDLHLIEKIDDPDNEFASAYVRVAVTFNKHRMFNNQVGI